MTVMKRWCVVVTTFCVILLSFTFLYTRNHIDSPTVYETIAQTQYRTLSPKTNKLKLQDTLVNLDNFEFVMNNASLCIDSTTTETHSILVIMIHSARYNFDRRYAIRTTWGSIKTFRQWRFSLIFLLGSDPTQDPRSLAENRLWDESKAFGDIVMGNFVDSYRNLTYKHLMGYKWVSTFCPTAKYILKTDDDVFADLFQIVDVPLMELINSQKSYACENMGGNVPDRTNLSKCAYLVKAEDASKIYSISNRTTFFWVDDVFVTGVLREKYDKIVDTGSNRSLQILTLYNRHHLGNKEEIIRWCTKDLSTNQLNYAFVLLNNQDFIRDMFCIWNKVRLLRFAMSLGLD